MRKFSMISIDSMTTIQFEPRWTHFGHTKINWSQPRA